MFIGSQFVLPENSIKLAMDACKIGSLKAMRGVGGIGQIPLGSLKAIVPARSERLYPSLNGLSGACCSSCAEHSEGSEGCCSGRGMGNLSLSDTFSSIGDTLQTPSPIMGLPWLYVAGAGALLLFLFGTRVDSADYKYERAKASKEYRDRLRQLKDEYPSRGRAAGRHIARGYREARGLFA